MKIDPTKALSLYVHYPFCRRKCDYCVFYSEVVKGESPLYKYYEEKLMQEVEEVVNRRQAPFETLYIGGGNPALASKAFLVKLLERVNALGYPRESTIEMNSESLNSTHSYLFEMGITRLSIGLQSLNAQNLITLGRHVSLDNNWRAIEIAQKFRNNYGVHLNYDLITSIPHQTVQEALDELRELVKYGEPDHISLYNLTIEEGSHLARRQGFNPLGEEEQAEILFALWDELEALGYRQYEVSNFARTEDDRARHNERYWLLEDYVGLGSSAVSLLGNTIYTNQSTLKEYGEKETFSTYLKEVLTQSELMESQLMMSLRRVQGIAKREWFERYKVAFDALFKAPIEALMQAEHPLVINTPDNFALSSQGFMLLDSIVLLLARALE
ncbi:MAG: coproporphyrinogen-III oxidase family protein [Sphaerochaetaceae bacterium]